MKSQQAVSKSSECDQDRKKIKKKRKKKAAKR